VEVSSYPYKMTFMIEPADGPNATNPDPNRFLGQVETAARLTHEEAFYLLDSVLPMITDAVKSVRENDNGAA
jgi:hypothetical protein